MKNQELLKNLRDQVKKVIELRESNAKLQKEREEQRKRDEAKKEAEKCFKNLEKEMLNDASKELMYHFVCSLKSNKFEEWEIDIQEKYKLLQEKGFDPEIRDRKPGDVPTSYEVEKYPYFIIISWEE